jgi:Zinc knuckle
MDDKLARIRDLIDQKEKIDAELESILGGPLPKMRKPQTCSKCGEQGHTARSCTTNPGAAPTG